MLFENLKGDEKAITLDVGKWIEMNDSPVHQCIAWLYVKKPIQWGAS